MGLIFDTLGKYLQLIDERNKGIITSNLLGIDISKQFIPSVANTIGTDLSNYKLLRKRRFACNPMHVGRDKKLPVAMYKEETPAIVSNAYFTFEIIDNKRIDPEYLTLIFQNPNFDRVCWFRTDASVRGGITWEDLCALEIPLLSIDDQLKVVRIQHIIDNRIELLQKINKNLLQQAEAILATFFIDFSYFGGVIPDDWEQGTLQDIADFSNGYAFKSEELLDVPQPNCYQVFKQGHINRGGGFNSSGTKSWYPISKCANLSKYILRKGDVLMAMTDMKENVAILGNTALMTVDNQYVLNQRVALLRSNGYKSTSYAYIYLLTNSFDFLKDLRSRANSGVQVNLSSTEIKNSPVIIANRKVNEEFNSIVEPMLEMIMANDIENQKLAQLRGALLPRLMSGELDVSELDV